MIPRRILAVLVVVALVLPVALCVLLGIARLLGAMGDAAGAAVLDRLGLAGGILWVIALIGLLLVLAIQAIAPPGGPGDEVEP